MENTTVKVVHRYLQIAEISSFDQNNDIPIQQVGENPQISVVVFSHGSRLNNDFCLNPGISVNRALSAFAVAPLTFTSRAILMQQKTLRSVCLLV
jgi:hypothetical protein